MNFNKTTSYALNVLSYMAKHHEEKISASRLCNELDIPYSYLRQILGKLSKKGFIKSAAGRSGGFLFSRNMDKIHLSEIVEAIEGLESLDRCVMGFSDCPFNNRCAMHPLWERIRGEILDALHSTTLADLTMTRR